MQETRKTPFEMFLEDDGPYSRKLFGPVPSSVPNLSVSHTDTRGKLIHPPPSPPSISQICIIEYIPPFYQFSILHYTL